MSHLNHMLNMGWAADNWPERVNITHRADREMVVREYRPVDALPQAEAEAAESEPLLCERISTLIERAKSLNAVVAAHEARRLDVSAARGYDVGHAGEFYPRRMCKAAIQREIREMRAELLSLGKEFER